MNFKIAKYTATVLLLAFVTLFFQECFMFRKKNGCNSCPALVKRKKVRKATKGSI